MLIRVTEQISNVSQISYDIRIDNGKTLDEIEDEIEDYLNRARDEVHRMIIQSNREIINIEKVE